MLLRSLLGVRLLMVLGLCLILGVMGLRLLLGVVLVRPLMRLLGNCLLLVLLLLVGVGLMALQGGLLVWCCLLRLQVWVGLVGPWLRLMRLLGRVGNVRMRSARLQGVRPESVLIRA
ncbi:hypothetical protein AB0B21_16370 [Streptomyces rimosus]|uniref:hypothetical protein n=1 Tax=Streptomyces rimosus TaxID=1927 RepID=UPI00131CADBF|nr:hypothetical protein [Streptomyces rimosus]